jgi:hypothetical protein
VGEPSTVYLENWHIDLIAEAVDDLSGKLAYRPDRRAPRGGHSRPGLRRLLINIRKIDLPIDYVVDVGLGARAVR